MAWLFFMMPTMHASGQPTAGVNMLGLQVDVVSPRVFFV
jgi:hypothetical protein